MLTLYWPRAPVMTRTESSTLVAALFVQPCYICGKDRHSTADQQ